MRQVPLADRPLTEPHPDRLSPGTPRRDELLGAHADAMRRGAETYRDPETGLSVFTAAFLAGRGSCCDTGCRHCPFLP